MLEFLQQSKIEIEEEKLSEVESNFRLWPLFPGTAHSLGNAIRRALLSIVRGLAVTEMRISVNNVPVKHLLSTMPPIIEDFLEISSRVKKIELSGELVKDEDIEKSNSILLNSLVLKGPLYASNLISPPQIEILNKDLLLMTFSKDAMLNIELRIEEGVGYRKASIESDLNDNHTISLESIFSKVIKSVYSIRPIVAGECRGMDELIVNLKTRRSITPGDAFSEVIDFLLNNLTMIKSSISAIPENTEEKQESVDEEKSKQRPISMLNLSTRASNCLHNNNIHDIEQLKEYSFEELMNINNLGSKSINEIVDKLKEFDIILK